MHKKKNKNDIYGTLRIRVKRKSECLLILSKSIEEGRIIFFLENDL